MSTTAAAAVRDSMTATGQNVGLSTDAAYAAADALVAAVEAAGFEGITPSRAARKAKVTTWQAQVLLRWLVSERMVTAAGNGAWTRYHAWTGQR
jgi:hypothetical protein